MVLSWLSEARRFPFGLRATELIMLSCPLGVCLRVSDAMSQRPHPRASLSRRLCQDVESHEGKITSVRGRLILQYASDAGHARRGDGLSSDNRASIRGSLFAH